MYGPASKGITVAAVTAVALAAKGHNLPYSFNRKEAKDHGEGGVIVGAALKGRVLIVDDVITDGGAKREAIELIRTQGAIAAGVLIAFDRMERGRGERSAVQELEREFGLPVVAIATLDDLLKLLARRGDLAWAGRAANRPERAPQRRQTLLRGFPQGRKLRTQKKERTRADDKGCRQIGEK